MAHSPLKQQGRPSTESVREDVVEARARDLQPAATANPLASRTEARIVVHEGRIEVAGQHLTPIAAWLWTKADGCHDVPSLAAIASRELGMRVDSEAIWQALDTLADAGLLQHRAAPPTGCFGLTRRAVLQAAAALVVMRAVGPHAATAAEVPAAQSDDRRQREQDALDRARAHRRDGDLDAAARSTDEAKALRRERLEFERQAEQERKTRLSEEIDAARPQPPPPSVKGKEAARESTTLVESTRTPRRPDDDLPSAPIPRTTPEGFSQQEQELKRNQERHDKRLREP